LIVIFVLLCCTAPWWPDVYQRLKAWRSPPIAIPRENANQVTVEELDELASRVRPGMTMEQVNGVFGFKPNQVYPAGPGVIKANWLFSVSGKDFEGISKIFNCEFESGRLRKSLLYAPI